jgi:hypothetical protein
MPKLNEVWKDIKGYEGFYKISSFGRVKSLGKRTHCGFCRRELILSSHKDKNGYLYVNLFLNGKRKTCKIHRLVGLTFILNSNHKEQINHKDGIKAHNYSNNLEWVSHQENMIHRREILNIRWEGEKVNTAKLTELDVLAIRGSFLNQIELAKIYKVDRSTIHKIILRKTWKHI